MPRWATLSLLVALLAFAGVVGTPAAPAYAWKMRVEYGALLGVEREASDTATATVKWGQANSAPSATALANGTWHNMANYFVAYQVLMSPQDRALLMPCNQKYYLISVDESGSVSPTYYFSYAAGGTVQAVSLIGTNTVQANIVGTPTVSVAGTPTVSINPSSSVQITGTPAVSISSSGTTQAISTTMSVDGTVTVGDLLGLDANQARWLWWLIGLAGGAFLAMWSVKAFGGRSHD